ncbi:CBS domain-containing protein [Pseudoroseicyclus tamaricis]|uniref:CBS domain-containing protein n=1 Tax=Pseudoroseicyclus tamaricis TaxID=2705421 RepID=A0A6B2JKY2_9RHOB|nr:CBS domain-containing protein [Pseudoroseicyclus tamaricis]NDV02173.1 CBS domain-containing protein [Pseudoroseicyclus tamaricis]
MPRTLGDLAALRTLVSAEPDMPILDACKRMCQERIGAIVVMRGENLVGIVSERDILRRVICRLREVGETNVGDVMTPGPITGEEGESLVEGLKKMRAHDVRHLPVMRDGVPVGIVAERDMPPASLLALETPERRVERLRS